MEYAFVGDNVGAPGCPGPAPVMLKAACRGPCAFYKRATHRLHSPKICAVWQPADRVLRSPYIRGILQRYLGKVEDVLTCQL